MRWHQRRLTWGTVAAVALICGVTAIVLAPSGQQPASLPAAAATTVPGASASPSPVSQPAAIPRSVPVSLTIPGIGTGGCTPGVTGATVVPEGTTGGALDVPPLSGSAAYDVGWWDGGAAPGQDGPAVLAGHVNSATIGNLTFACLAQMQPGMTAVVTLKDGAVVTFTATATQEVAKTAFPTDAVYGPTGYPALRLITCGGTFDPQTGHYDDNLIVYLTETATAG